MFHQSDLDAKTEDYIRLCDAFNDANARADRAEAASAAKDARIAWKDERISQLEAALGWYADPISYATTQVAEPRSAVHADGGKRARLALHTATGEKS